MERKRPSLLTKAKNLSKAAIGAYKHLEQEGEILVDRAEYDARVAVCEKCPYYEEFAKDECGQCGCYVKTSKAWLASTCCPDNKWEGDYEKADICE